MKNKVPIMSSSDERFMAFTGLIQWARGVISVSKRLDEKHARLDDLSDDLDLDHVAFMDNFRCEQHYFVISAYKLIEYRNWVEQLELCEGVDFSGIDSFLERDIRDLRNMHEHIIDYFKGIGRYANRWTTDAPDYSADASSGYGRLIGGRLDYREFSQAAKQLLDVLNDFPVPRAS